MKLSNKVYDVLKWICMVLLPASITLFGVIGKTLGIPSTDTILTIAVAVNPFLGSILGLSNMSYKKSLEGGETDGE